jgi:hypothetical protein
VLEDTDFFLIWGDAYCFHIDRRLLRRTSSRGAGLGTPGV